MASLRVPNVEEMLTLLVIIKLVVGVTVTVLVVTMPSGM